MPVLERIETGEFAHNRRKIFRYVDGLCCKDRRPEGVGGKVAIAPHLEAAVWFCGYGH